MPANAPSYSTADNRLMRAIMAACKRLGIDHEERRALVADLTGKASMKDCNARELGIVLDRLNQGWKRQEGHGAHLGKIKALWWTLYWCGAVESADEKAISAFVKRQTGITSLRFVDHRAAPAIIEALKDWCQRIAIVWPSSDDLADVQQRWPKMTMQRLERIAVLKWLDKKLMDNRILGASLEYAATALSLYNSTAYGWSDPQCDDAIRLLGKKWRDARPSK